MGNKYKDLYADVAFISFLMINLIVMYIMVASKNISNFNIVMLNVTYVFLIITYFLPTAGAIILSILGLFTYSTVVLLLLAMRSIQLNNDIYLWLIVLPLCMTLIILFKHSINGVYKKNEHINKQLESYLTYDEEIGIVKERIKDNINNEEIVEITRPNNIKLQMKVGVHRVDESEELTPNDLYYRALNETNYDLSPHTKTMDEEVMVVHPFVGYNILSDILLLTMEDHEKKAFVQIIGETIEKISNGELLYQEEQSECEIRLIENKEGTLNGFVKLHTLNNL